MTVHVVGAGLAGLAAAVRLSAVDIPLVVHEAAAHGGGRCRSFHDNILERSIDNGNHLLLSGNMEAMAYIEAIGSAASFHRPGRAAFDFMDLENDRRWSVRPGRGRWPWWLLRRDRRAPGGSLFDYLAVLKLAWAAQNATVAEVLGPDLPLFRNFWQPLCVSVLNTPAEEAAASLLWPVLKQTFGRGEAACRPCVASRGLSESLVDPALDLLAGGGAPVRFGRRLKSIGFSGDRVDALSFGDGNVALDRGDTVILAVAAEAAVTLVDDLVCPDRFGTIVNGHFLLPDASRDKVMLGLVGGVSHWIFVRGDVVSVTVSAADALAGETRQRIAATLWREIAAALRLGDTPLGPYRIIREKRATFAQTPAQARRRPDTRTRWRNLLLAGDWTATGLPATIEGAVASGHRAADLVIRGRSTPAAT